jgi:hypothetical protein
MLNLFSVVYEKFEELQELAKNFGDILFNNIIYS